MNLNFKACHIRDPKADLLVHEGIPLNDGSSVAFHSKPPRENHYNIVKGKAHKQADTTDGGSGVFAPYEPRYCD